MKPSFSIPLYRLAGWLGLALCLSLLRSWGQDSSPATNSPAPAAKGAGAAAQSETPGPAASPAPNALIQQLLDRIEALEKRDSAQAKESEKAHQEAVGKLLNRIGELEKKVGELESRRVLPEITVTAEDAPTPHEIDQRVRILERRGELAAEAADARAKEQPRLSLGQDGFSFSSADTNFTLKIKGVVQADSRVFFNDNALLKGNDSFLLRRARPIIEGTVFRDFDFQMVPDFGGSSVQLMDANLNYKYRPELQLRAGKFKSPVGLEQLQPDAGLLFNERSLVTDLVPNRNVGLQLWGDIGEGSLSYAVGIFNGTGDSRNPNNSDFADDKEFAGRIFVQPFRHTDLGALQGLGFGLGGSYSRGSSNSLALPNTTGGTLAGYTTDGQQQFFAYNPTIGTVVADGPHWRLSPQGTYLLGPFGVQGEYAISHQGVRSSYNAHRAQLDNTAWDLSAQWVLPGEPASFTGITPLRPFAPSAGRWGAWQLVARFGQLDIDDAAFSYFANPATSARSATAWSAGINWWLNKNVRVLTSFSHTTFQGGGSSDPLTAGTSIPPATVSHQDENVFFTRVQLAF